MREMLSDVMTSFVGARYPVWPEWPALSNTQNIVQAFRGPRFRGWMFGLSQECQKAVTELVRYIFSVLHDTGFNKAHNEFVIACMLPEDPTYCFRIRSDVDKVWTQALGDSKDRATYAYATAECLQTAETAEIYGRNNLPSCMISSSASMVVHELVCDTGEVDRNRA